MKFAAVLALCFFFLAFGASSVQAGMNVIEKEQTNERNKERFREG